MLNVVEHVRSAFLLYENLYAAIKPGGRLVFGDRCWDDELNLMFHSPGGSTRWKQYIGPNDLTGATGSKSDEDVVGQLDGSAVTQWAQQITDKTHRDVEMHPILTSCKLVTDFLSLFHPEFEMWKKRSAVP